MQERTGEFFPGSPFNALMVKPPFREYHYIDIDRKKIDELEKLAGSRKDIKIYHGDCNKVLLNKVLPCAKYSDFRRALFAMRNTQNAVVYYLFFAAHKPVAEDIVKDIFKKYKNRRG